MQLELNRRSKVPMYRQLAAELREQIVSGAMAEGYRQTVRASGSVSTALRSEVSGFFNSWLTSAAKLSIASIRS